MTRLARIALGNPCARLPWLAWVAGVFTDGSALINISLYSYTKERTFDLQVSVRFTHFQHGHGFGANGNACLFVRSKNTSYSHNIIERRS
jgi:hypothetical protein